VVARIQSISPGHLFRGGPAIFFASRKTDIRVCLPQALRSAICGLVVASLLSTAPATARTAQSPSAPPKAPATPVQAKPDTPAAQPQAASTSHPSAKKKKKSVAATRRQLSPDPSRIREIQEALVRQGFYEGEPTGKWDSQTVSAMKGFQEAKGLAPTGKIDALSLQKLGLGSPTAGIAPPATKTPPQPQAPAVVVPPAGSPTRPMHDRNK
jgi:peptidoglycan hydrolase-like protein with peptidoglycan-binding domain